MLSGFSRIDFFHAAAILEFKARLGWLSAETARATICAKNFIQAVYVSESCIHVQLQRSKQSVNYY